MTEHSEAVLVVAAQATLLFIGLLAMVVGYSITWRIEMGSWFEGRKSEAETRLSQWAKVYTVNQVRFLAEAMLKVTRSPGKREAYNEWLATHPLVVEAEEVQNESV